MEEEILSQVEYPDPADKFYHCLIRFECSFCHRVPSVSHEVFYMWRTWLLYQNLCQLNKIKEEEEKEEEEEKINKQKTVLSGPYCYWIS